MNFWQATVADVDKLFELDLHCYKSNSLNKQEWKLLLSKKKYLVLVTGDLLNPTSFVVASSDGKETNTILRLGVAEENRRKKIATEVVAFLGETRNLKLKLRETNSEAIRFCCSLGFKAVSVLWGEFGTEDGILFVRNPNGHHTELDEVELQHSIPPTEVQGSNLLNREV